jgi:tetratricopeptide (TPR) repeat protein
MPKGFGNTRPPQAIDLYNQGVTYQQRGNLTAAIPCYRQALARDPYCWEAHYNLGLALYQTGQTQDAVTALQQTVQLNPDFAPAYCDLALALEDLERFDEALNRYQFALLITPDYPEAWVGTGNILQKQLKLEMAASAYRHAIALRPNYPEALNNLGFVLHCLDHVNEAIACFRQALALKPKYPDALSGLGNALLDVREIEKAFACQYRALELDPAYKNGHGNLARALLITGTLAEGWQEYAWRSQLGAKTLTSSGLETPCWDGSPLAGKTILLKAEQGLGDQIQFIRYAPLVQANGGVVLAECDHALKQLFQSCPGLDGVYSPQDTLPPLDVHIPLLSLPSVLQTTMATIPAQISYLKAPAAPSLPVLAERLLPASQGHLKIGIAWSGNIGFHHAQKRHCPIHYFDKLFQLPGTSFFSVYRGEAMDELAGYPVVNLGELFQNFADTAYALQQLDLVITVDTSVVHLAGALGIPTWLLLCYTPDWRWFLDREDTPWYPSVRLFRQPSIGDWSGVMTAVEIALKNKLKG